MAKVRVVVLMEPAEVARIDGIANSNHVSRGQEVRKALSWWSDYCLTARDPNGPPSATMLAEALKPDGDQP